MEKIKVTCPQCKKIIKAPASLAGKKRPCPGCKAIIVIPEKASQPAPAPVTDNNQVISASRIKEFDSRLEGISNELKSHIDKVGRELHALEGIQKELREKISDSTLEDKTREVLAPHLDRIKEALTALQIEKGELEISESERREIVHRYKIGTVDRLRQELEEQEKIIANKDRALSEKTARIDALERANILASIDRTNKDWPKYQDILEKYESALSENKEMLALRVEKNDLQAENLKLRALEETYRQNVENSVRNFELEKLSQSQADIIKGLQNEKGRNLDTITGLKKESRRLHEELNETHASLMEQGNCLIDEQHRVQELNQTLEPLIKNQAAVEKERLDLIQKKTQLETEWRQKREILEREFEVYRKEIEDNTEGRIQMRLDNQYRNELENLKHELKNLRERYQQSESDLREALSEKAEFDRNKSLALKDLNDLVERSKDLKEQIKALEKELSTQKAAITGLKAEATGLEQRCDLLRRDLEDLKEQRNNLGKSVGYERRIESIVDPCFKEIFPVAEWEGPEIQWLDKLEDSITEAEFVFQKRLLYAFHTSLKISDISQLTVLAGVSGTGKSELPKLYAHFGGFNFLSVPVQATWDSPQDIFGFYDYLECRYKATTFLRTLVQSQSNGGHGLVDGLLIILLDEMNIARVELYFSELLSRLENRRSLAANAKSDLGRMEIDVGAGAPPYSFPLGRNVMYVGTINEDETTNALSDKVLDRGNVISFPRPATLHSRKSLNPISDSKFRLARSTWKKWIRSPSECLTGDVLGELRSDLERINSALSHVNRAIGHRVLQAIEAYVANYPGVRDRADSWKIPFADQIVQRIMPKLRGIEVESDAGRRCIKGVGEVVNNYDISKDFEVSLESSDGVFRWTSSKYIENPPTCG